MKKRRRQKTRRISLTPGRRVYLVEKERTPNEAYSDGHAEGRLLGRIEAIGAVLVVLGLIRFMLTL